MQFEQWLRGLGASPAVIHDLGLAVYEALANSAEHAYPANHPTRTVDLDAKLDGSHLTITITDHGRWQHPDAPNYHGRGLSLINQLVDTVHLNPSQTGTSVQLRTTLGS